MCNAGKTSFKRGFKKTRERHLKGLRREKLIQETYINFGFEFWYDHPNIIEYDL